MDAPVAATARPRDPLEVLAVVIPVAPGDDAWRGLLDDLATLPPETEILFAGTEPLAGAARVFLADRLAGRPWRWLAAPRGRARQLNVAADATRRDYLWFLHADSRFARDTVSRMRASLTAAPDALHYSDLGFLPDGPRAVHLNALAVRWRARWLGMPFGDQGLCIAREVFVRLGGFDETAAYGEDHLLVWRARRAGIALRASGGTLLTSARRYRDRGWARTTARHLWLTARQALPEWLLLLRSRRERRTSAVHRGGA
jgi:hypothetical protein